MLKCYTVSPIINPKQETNHYLLTGKGGFRGFGCQRFVQNIPPPPIVMVKSLIPTNT